jgi:hypothetical protein
MYALKADGYYNEWITRRYGFMKFEGHEPVG